MNATTEITSYYWDQGGKNTKSNTDKSLTWINQIIWDNWGKPNHSCFNPNSCNLTMNLSIQIYFFINNSSLLINKICFYLVHHLFLALHFRELFIKLSLYLFKLLILHWNSLLLLYFFLWPHETQTTVATCHRSDALWDMHLLHDHFRAASAEVGIKCMLRVHTGAFVSQMHAKCPNLSWHTARWESGLTDAYEPKTTSMSSWNWVQIPKWDIKKTGFTASKPQDVNHRTVVALRLNVFIHKVS